MMTDSEHLNSKLWAGRFQKQTDRLFERFSDSTHFDWILYDVDIEGSLAHASMLCHVGLISLKENNAIEEGLKEIRSEIQKKGQAWFDPSLEDVHMNIEKALIKKIGSVGEKIHTGRSRNDQVVLDLRMKLKKDSQILCDALSRLMKSLVFFAEKHKKVILPEMTHLQHAQPVLMAHHMLAYVEMFKRDRERVVETYGRIDVMPLGSGACVGSGLPLDREFVRKKLGFSRLSQNSVDAVSDRDFVIEFLSNLSLMSLHLSRLSEEWILWSTSEFSFLILGDQYCTGSSMMPQKKNADSLELIRGQSAQVYGDLIAVLVLLKGLPLAYNRDMQHDKWRLFLICEKVIDALDIMTGVVANAQVNAEICQKNAESGFAYATDISDYLVKKGMPFRQSHKIVGSLVFYCVENSCEVKDLSLEQLRKFSELFDRDLFDVLSLESCVSSKDVLGGTAPQRVIARIEYWKRELEKDCVFWRKKEEL